MPRTFFTLCHELAPVRAPLLLAPALPTFSAGDGAQVSVVDGAISRFSQLPRAAAVVGPATALAPAILLCMLWACALALAVAVTAVTLSPCLSSFLLARHVPNGLGARMRNQAVEGKVPDVLLRLVLSLGASLDALLLRSRVRRSLRSPLRLRAGLSPARGKQDVKHRLIERGTEGAQAAKTEEASEGLNS